MSYPFLGGGEGNKERNTCTQRYKIREILIKNQKEKSRETFHRTAGANQARRKRRSLQAGR